MARVQGQSKQEEERLVAGAGKLCPRHDGVLTRLVLLAQFSGKSLGKRGPQLTQCSGHKVAALPRCSPDHYVINC